MSIILSQTPIALRNPYSVLDAETEFSNTASTDAIVTYIVNSRAPLSRAMSDDWSVVNSAYGSDDEDENEAIEEIYIDASAAQLAPLTVSALSDGFTNISKTMTATSINSSSAATAQPDAWVVKISKKRQQSTQLRKSKTPTAAAPSLEDVVEGSESDVNDNDGYDDEEKENMDHGTGGDLYMSMTEHELSKSSKAVNLKNVRLATTHDTELCKALGITSRNNNCPKPPKSSSGVKDKKNEKSRVRSLNLD